MSFPSKTCSECGREFNDAPNRKGFINTCEECSKPRPTEEQRRQWEEDVRYFVNSEGEEVHFDVVKTVRCAD